MKYIPGLFIISVFSLSSNINFQAMYSLKPHIKEVMTTENFTPIFAVYLLALAVHCSFGFPLFWYDLKKVKPTWPK